MPRTYLCKNDDRDTQIKVIINTGLIQRGMMNKDLIKKSGIAQSTFYSDMRNPESMTVERLRTYLDTLKIPTDQRGGCL